MSTIDRLPLALRNRSSVVSMANQLDRSKREAARLRGEVKKPPGLIAVALPTLGAAFVGGAADARMPSLGPRGNIKPSQAAGLVGLGAAYMWGNESALYAAVGMLTPHAYAAGVQAAGYELAILEDQEDAGDTA